MEGGNLDEDDYHPSLASPSSRFANYRGQQSPQSRHLHGSSSRIEDTYPPTANPESHTSQIPIALYAASNFRAVASNAGPSEAFASSVNPDDFYRSYRGVQSSQANLLPSPVSPGKELMASALPAIRQTPSLRSNGNGTTPRHPAVPAVRSGQRPAFRSVSTPADERSASGGTRSTPGMSNGSGGGTQPSVKDLKKKFDQNASQSGIPTARKMPPRNPTTRDPAGSSPYSRSPAVGSSQASYSNLRTTNDATKRAPSRGTQRPKFVAEDQLSSNSQSFASRISRPRNTVSTNPQASKSMVHLTPQTSPVHPTASPVSSRQNGLLFGEILPDQNDSSTAGHGIDGFLVRRTSDSHLRHLIRSHQRSLSDHDLEPPSPTDWYRTTAPPRHLRDNTKDLKISKSHNRAHSDLGDSRASTIRANNVPAKQNIDESLPPQPSSPSRIPLSVKKLNSPSQSPSPTSTRSNSPTAHKRPPQTGRSSTRQQPSQQPASRAKTPTARSTTPTTRAKTPTHTSTATRKAVPNAVTIPNNNRLNAYISAPPPKLSPPLRSSRPRQPVSAASTASSRMKVVDRANSPHFASSGRRGSKPDESANARSRKISVGPVDFAQRRETIKLAYSKSIRESQAREARQEAAERRKRELEEIAKAKAKAEAAAAAVAASASQSEENVSAPEPSAETGDAKAEHPLRITTSIQRDDVDSPTLGIPGSFPTFGSPQLGEEEVPQSAVSGVTEFDNEPQTDPPVPDTNTPSKEVKPSILDQLAPIREVATYRYPFDDEDANESISIKISLDASSAQPSLNPTPTRSEFEVERSIPGSFQDEYEPKPYTFASPSYETTVTILGPDADFKPSSHDRSHDVTRFSQPSSVDEYDEKAYPIKLEHSDSGPNNNASQPDADFLHDEPEEPGEDLDNLEDFYVGPHMRDNIAALRGSTITSSDTSLGGHKTPDTSHSLSIPRFSPSVNRSSQQSVWTDFSFDSHDSASRGLAATSRQSDIRRQRSTTAPQTLSDLAQEEAFAAGLLESPDLSPLEISRPVSVHNVHRLPELDTDHGFSIPYLSTEMPQRKPAPPTPALPDHEPPPPPTDDYDLDDPVYFDDTRPSSYLHSQNDDESEEFAQLSTPHSTDKLSVEVPDMSTAPTLVEVKGPSDEEDGASGKEKNRLTQRQWVIRELIDTEAIFVRDMSVVEEIYKGTAEACPKLDSKTIKLIFRNTDEIIAFHTSFLAQLKDGVSCVYTPKGRRSPLLKEDSSKDSKIDSDATTLNSTVSSANASTKADINDVKDRQTSVGPVFSKNVEKMKSAHEGYLRTSDHATKRLIQIQADPTVKVWLNECNEVAKDLTAAWNLDSLLIKPMQRLTKYPNLISQLLEHTPADHPDREALVTARTTVENAILEINKTKKNFELVGQIVGRKRKESDVKASLTRAFGKRVDKLQASSNRPLEDDEYVKLHEKFNDDYLRLQVVLRDVEFYSRTVSAYVHEFLQYLSSMELVMRLQPSPYPELESKWVQFNVSMRDIEKVALEQHTSAVRKHVIEPFEQVIRCYGNPSLAMKKRAKRRLDYEKSVQLKRSGKKVDKQLAELVEQYEALNDTLKKELPKLSALTTKIGNICLGKFVCLQATWYGMWKEKVKVVLDASSHIPEFAEIVTTFQRDFKDVVEQAQNIGILNPTLKSRTSQSTTDETHPRANRPRPAELTPRGRGLSVNSDQAPSLPTPDFLKRHSGQLTLSPTATVPSPGHYYRDYYAGINGHARGGSGSPVTPELSASSRSVAPSARPSTGRSYESSVPRQSSDSTAQTSVQNRRDSNSTFNSNHQGPETRRFSGLFHSALPMADAAEESQRSSRASSRERAAANSGYTVLWLAASLFEFNIQTTKHEAGYPYLTYQAGEIFDVIAEKGELWLAKNQDDPNVTVGWIWSKHFAKLADS